MVEQGFLIHTEVDVMGPQNSTATSQGGTYIYDDLTVGISTEDRPVTGKAKTSQGRLAQLDLVGTVLSRRHDHHIENCGEAV